MLRACSVLATIVLFSTSGFAADLVWMKLCTSKDFDAAANDCVWLLCCVDRGTC